MQATALADEYQVEKMCLLIVDMHLVVLVLGWFQNILVVDVGFAAVKFATDVDLSIALETNVRTFAVVTKLSCSLSLQLEQEMGHCADIAEMGVSDIVGMMVTPAAAVAFEEIAPVADSRGLLFPGILERAVAHMVEVVCAHVDLGSVNVCSLSMQPWSLRHSTRDRII